MFVRSLKRLTLFILKTAAHDVQRSLLVVSCFLTRTSMHQLYLIVPSTHRRWWKRTWIHTYKWFVKDETAPHTNARFEFKSIHHHMCIHRHSLHALTRNWAEWFRRTDTIKCLCWKISLTWNSWAPAYNAPKFWSFALTLAHDTLLSSLRSFSFPLLFLSFAHSIPSAVSVYVHFMFMVVNENATTCAFTATTKYTNCSPPSSLPIAASLSLLLFHSLIRHNGLSFDALTRHHSFALYSRSRAVQRTHARNTQNRSKKERKKIII